MQYTETFNRLKLVFDPHSKETPLPGDDLRIVNLDFVSDPVTSGFINENDTSIDENRSFSYPVFVPPGKQSRRVILLLHGLNERSWLKYLPWAYRLATDTGSYVLLFPISFHINRSPESWKDPRMMLGAVKERVNISSDVRMSTFANVALSNRLSEDPLRFFRSGYQTANDIIKLMVQIRDGSHQLIPGGSRVDLFTYSIGAFLGEIMMMGNPENLFSGSKQFIFCGGSVFSNMKGTSKLIMDSLAFDRVYGYYMNDFEKTIRGRSNIVEFLRTSQIGMAFRSMIDHTRLRPFRENILKKLREQIHSIALIKDTVIPPRGIVETLSQAGSGLVDVTDFPYSYSHENPFPVFDNPDSVLVDRCFDRVFSEARVFLA